MRASYLQRQLKLNEQVLAGLHEEYKNLRALRKQFNEEADKLAVDALRCADEESFAMAGDAEHLSKANREQASVYTPYILKFKRKIEKLSQVQKALKVELKCQQALEMWSKEDDAFWLEQAKIAQEGGYVTPDSVDALFVSFPQEDA